MAGYSIDLLAPAEEVAGSENIAIHEGVTKRAKWMPRREILRLLRIVAWLD